MRSFFLPAVFLLAVMPVFSQGVTIGSSNPPDASAVLDLQSTSGGLLLPRLTDAQRNAIISPAVGLTIYNTTTNCVETYMPQGGWRQLKCDCLSYPSSAFQFSPATPSYGSNVTFTPNTTGQTYAWTFQGGTPSSGNTQNPVVQWANPGQYIITLTVTDGNGCSSTTTDTITISNCPSGTVTYSYTGSVQTFSVPNCVSQVTIEAWGAQGGNTGTANGGLGAYVKGTYTVTPGSTLNIYVGGQNGYNGGGTSSQGGGSGGGASDVRAGGTGYNNRIIVAGGGGGAGTKGNDCCTSNEGGNGGNGGLYGYAGSRGNNGSSTSYTPAQNGSTNGGDGGLGYYVGGGGGGGGSNGGGGGGESCSYCSCTVKAGGSGGTCGQNSSCGYASNGGCQGTGGNSGGHGGGGGGGWYGGGSGSYGNGNGWAGGGGGGGGSSYLGGGTNTTYTDGQRSGDGQVIITY